jgi:class 3 adenylate cyclase
MAEERKLVSVVFADIVGSTALGHDNDPEVVRAVLGRYFERAQQIIDSFGGSVEKYIGDAVMAVFGVPRVHDDDAERAVRSALAIDAAMAPLNEELALHLQARIGVNSGEAVAAVDDREQRLVTGDVVNVAARLQQQAEPGQVVVGALTEQLTRAAIEYAELEPIVARGKPEPIVAFRALRARSELPEQARGLPQMRARLVGRTRELTLLADTLERARSDSRGQLFSLVGNAGVGKSRLVGEFLARAGSTVDARVLRGRCLPYGAGITYWPFIEMLQTDLGVSGEQSRQQLLDRLEARLGAMTNPGLRMAVYARLTVLLGLAEASHVLPDVAGERLPAEIGWALAEYVALAGDQAPAIVVIDDLQWAEPAAVAIVRELFDALADGPYLLLCIARPELLEHYADWGGGLANATTVVLEPLSEAETRTLIGRLLDVDDMPERLRAKVISRSAGNPLFCEEFVRMLIDEGRIVRQGERWRGAATDSFEMRVPESIQALLAARLDGLPADHKAVVQSASIIGEQFEARQVEQLAGQAVGTELQALTRSGFVLPNRASGPGGYRFKHILIRDVAYASLPKAERARLHEQFGTALEAEVGDRRDEYVEILAHHAERTLALSLELRMAGSALATRARRALELALEGGRRALERGDLEALNRFIATAHAARTALGPVGDDAAIDVALLEAQSKAQSADYAGARLALAELAAAAEQADRLEAAAAANLALYRVLVFAGGEGDQADRDQALGRARELFRQLGDQTGELQTELQSLEREFGQGRLGRMLELGLPLIERARALGEDGLAAQVMARLIQPAAWSGQLDLADRLIEQGGELSARLGLRPTARLVHFFRARVAWMRGDFVGAEQQLRALQAEAEAADDGGLLVGIHRLLCETFMEQERLEEAEAEADAALAQSVRTGDRWSRTELLAMKAYFRGMAGDLDRADKLLEDSLATLRTDDPEALSVYSSLLGLIRARQGRHQEAEEALRASMAIIRDGDAWWWLEPSLDLAEFLLTRGRRDEAARLVAEVEAGLPAGVRVRQRQIDRLKGQLGRLRPGAAPVAEARRPASD